MAINKKGVFFSLTSLLVVGVLLVTLNADTTLDAPEATLLRVQDFGEDRALLEEQILPTVLRTYAREVIRDIAETNAESEGAEITDVEQVVEDCLQTRVVGDQGYSYSTCSLQGYTERQRIRVALDRIEEKYASALQYDTSLELESIELTQTNPWSITAIGVFAVELDENADFARYKNARTVRAEIPIHGLIDPLSSEKRGQIQVIRQADYDETRESFNEHALAGTYVYNAQAPSYLNRLIEKSTPSSLGISSLIVNPESGLTSADYGDREAPECTYRFETGQGRVVLTNDLIASYRLFDEEFDRCDATGG